ncbi:DUF732 domain-containing protein [Mycolicibacterium sediminis]|uniref:DUF732 domain-containing protein n=2 Tax=Mycolicibacterium sediminis TaxID=1286180 RepID=A0A7I7QLX2_9MYCO|nr:DUF732 domain-containing protein [Mycolicibacterium sediminis]BBY26876.1 hypothetical protein MSEDJ_09720 [Mycolicibacterium sediminis]
MFDRRRVVSKIGVTLGAIALGTAASLAQAAPAAADNEQFLHGLEERYAFMTPQQLLAAGHKACAVVNTGVPAADASDVIDHQWGLSPSVAMDIVTSAITNLDC